MKRRQFVAASGALVAYGSGLVSMTAAADAAAHDVYTPELYDQALADGTPFLLDFFAPW